MKISDFKAISELHNNLVNAEDYFDFDETEEAGKKVSQAIIEPLKKIDKISLHELDDLIAAEEMRNQEQGFIHGFCYAMKLRKECDMI